MFTRAWHFSLETCRLFRGFALKGPVREQMAQRTGKDYQHGKGSSSVVKSFVNSCQKKTEDRISQSLEILCQFLISRSPPPLSLHALKKEKFKFELNKPQDMRHKK